MKPAFRFRLEGDNQSRVLWRDSDRVLGRWIIELDGQRTPVLAVWPATERPTSSHLSRLTHEYGLKEELDGPWAARPLELVRENGRTALLLEDLGDEPLAGMLGAPMELGRFLRLAIGIAAALSQLHRRHLVHKDLKPAHILVNDDLGAARLTGFGLASRQARERHAPAAAEEITGTLAYMAPEQTGRMNGPIDARSDLYAFGVTLYQMLTGVLPFATDDPMGLVHCHLARQPMPPVQRIPAIPDLLSDLVLRLLAKPAEERYQTATGLEADLRRCLAEWENLSRIDAFPLGAHDVPERPMTPSRLHGREREVQTLLAAYKRVAANGGPELVLVSGYSGLGKTSIVHELRKAVIAQGGLFASGKFDQFKREIQYAPLAQALQGLIRPLLGKSETALEPWRQALDAALGPNGALLAPLIPELELVLGPQPPVAVLPPRDTQHRLHQVFQSLLGVFARAEHPLVLFLDDLQWLDTATLDLLAFLATQPEMRHLLLVGAYRSNEVQPSHPLLQRLSAIRLSGGQVRDVKLAPLGVTDIGRLIADALHCLPAHVSALADLVQAKTAGNPFFAVQFLTTLADEDLLAFDQRSAGWSWDLEQILAKGFTENVADLMLIKLERLPEGTRDVLRILACLGNDATTLLLTTALGGDQTLLEEALWPAMHAGLVTYHAGTCSFRHDRIQEAAYRLIPEGARPGAHLEIGRRLAAGTPSEAVPDRIFEIVGQLNRGAALIHATSERERVAELNLLAGERAKAATAYSSALGCLAAGAALLRGDGWERRPELAFALAIHRAECEFLTGALPEAEARLADLADRASSLPDLARVTQLRLELFLARGQRERAVEVGLHYLSCAGIQCPSHPDKRDVQREFDRMWELIGNRPIEALRDLPLMTDAVSRGTMDVLTALMLPAWYTNVDLGSLVIGRMTNLSLEQGNCDASCLNYAWLGLLLGPRSGDYGAAFRFGQLGVDLVEQHGLDRFKARVYQAFGGHVMQWTRPIRTAHSLVQRAIDVAGRLGDLTYACFARNNQITQMLAVGEPLADVQREAESLIDFAYKARFSLAVDRVTPQLQLVRSLRGRTPVFGTLNDASFHEESYERYLDEPPGPTLATCWYWVRKLQARYLAGDYVTALAAADRAERLLWTCPSFFEQAEYHFYAALAHAAHDVPRAEPDRTRHLRRISEHHHQLLIWAEHCPENFQTRAALVGAELARIEDRHSDAMHLYEEAIRCARDNDFIHNEALANELAARCYAARGFEKIARVYLEDARDAYLRWGADGKVQQLEGRYPHLFGEEGIPPAPTATIGLPLERLDVATVIAVSQAISGEVVLDRLLGVLMKLALEQAGAERGVLVLSRGADLRIVAEASTSGDAVSVSLLDDSASSTAMPLSMLHYVVRTRDPIIVDNANTLNAFPDDPYFQQQRARSILCLPLLTHAKLIGVLYLENRLAPRVFSPARTAVLKLLASQAATAIENARLYRDLAQREAKIQCLLEANFIGIFIWHLDGRVLEANDAFLHMLGHDRADLASAGLDWRTDLTPPEWHERDAGLARAFQLTGNVPAPYEKEFFHKDGRRVPVLIGSARFEEGEDQGVSFVLNLSERKRAEEALHHAQAQLAHVTRVTTLNALTASIAHEVNQPLATIITNADSALRWLARQPPEIDEARAAVESVVQAGHRAGSVIGGMRTLFSKASPPSVALDLNVLIDETRALVQCEVTRHQVRIHTDLAADLPQVMGDRVQLQQVLLNLLMNGIEAMKGVTGRPRVLCIQSRRDADGAARIAVHDTGVGLEPGAEQRVFDGFYTTKSEGLGMGLTICRMIVEAHAGRLWASAHAPFGSTFQFTLPAAHGQGA